MVVSTVVASVANAKKEDTKKINRNLRISIEMIRIKNRVNISSHDFLFIHNSDSISDRMKILSNIKKGVIMTPFPLLTLKIVTKM